MTPEVKNLVDAARYEVSVFDQHDHNGSDAFACAACARRKILDDAITAVEAEGDVTAEMAAMRAALEEILPSFIVACRIGAPECDPERHICVMRSRAALARKYPT